MYYMFQCEPKHFAGLNFKALRSAVRLLFKFRCSLFHLGGILFVSGSVMKDLDLKKNRISVKLFN